MDLTAKHRATLRARAHSLKPVVQVGHAGVTPAVLEQIDGALTAHELIKVKLGKESPIATDDAAAAIASAVRAQVVQTIGRVLVAFRRNPKKPKVALGSKPKAAQGASKSGRQLLRRRRAAKEKGKRASRGGFPKPLRRGQRGPSR